MTIEQQTMQERLGKRLDQEEVYCTFRPKDILEMMEDSYVTHASVMKILDAIVDYQDVRMIMLRPLRQHDPRPKPNIKGNKPMVGGFVGLDYSQPPHKKRTIPT